jgi:cytochrome c biogenesis protein
MSLPDGSSGSLRRSIALVWRTLRSMRTAIVLLFMLAAAAMVGSLLPQLPVSPQRVASYQQVHRFWGSFFNAIGAFDVFGTWWFALITALLFISLVACLAPRSRALIRAARQQPVHARELDAFPSFTEQRVAAAPEDAARAAAAVLRRRRFRVALDAERGAVAAEKGSLREIGSLVFHWAFLVLLVAVIIGKGTGYVGHATIVEGETWTDARLNYNGDLRTGRFFGEDFSGTSITLLDYRDAFRTSGIPMDFSSDVRLATPDGSETADETVQINHPVVFNGIRVYQFGFGWAATVRLQEGPRVLYDGSVVLGQQATPGANPLAEPWVGVVKLQTLRPQVAIVLQLFPSLAAYVQTLQTGVPQPMTDASHPFIGYEVWKGRFVDPSVTGVDARYMHRTEAGVVGQGWTVNVDRGCVVRGIDAQLPASLAGLACPGGDGRTQLTMSFPGVKQYSTLQISHDATVGWVLAAAILIVLGLLPALYVSRRKVWVRARSAESGSVLQLGGFALQRKDSFDQEFQGLVEAITRAAGGTVDEAREEVPAG